MGSASRQFARAVLLVGVVAVLCVAWAAPAAAATDPGGLAFLQGFWNRVINPNYVIIFLVAGAVLVLFELVTPTGFIAGTVGGVLLAMGLVALSLLPVSILGVLLLLTGIALCVAEPFVPGVGWMAGVGGLGVAGATMVLFTDPGVEISSAALIPSVMVLLAVSVGTSIAARVSRDEPSTMGDDGLIGRVGTVRTSSGTRGQVFVAGETWRAVSDGGPLTVGQTVRVTEVEGLSLTVEPAPSERAP